MTPQRRVVLFDLDQTLTDRRKSLEDMAKRMAADYSSDLIRDDRLLCLVEDALRRADGSGYRPRSEVFAELLRTLPWQRTPDFSVIESYWQATFPQCTVGAAGLFATLDALLARGYRMGVITNGNVAVQEAKIDFLGLRPYMSTVVVSGAVGVGKPDGRIFEIALERLDARPSEAWFVGDHPVWDVIGATGAGLSPVWIRGSQPWPEGHEEPEFQIDHLEELLDLLG